MSESRILRYRFENNLGPRELQLPIDAEIVAAGHFDGAAALWVKTPDTEPGKLPDLEVRRFLLTTTGQTIGEELGRFIGTSIAAGHEILIFELESDAAASISLEERIEAVGSNAETMIDAFRDRLEAIESPTGVSIPDVDRALDIVSARNVALTDEIEALRRRVDGDERKLSALERELELEKNRLEDSVRDVERGFEGRVSELERIESSR